VDFEAERNRMTEYFEKLEAELKAEKKVAEAEFALAEAEAVATCRERIEELKSAGNDLQ